MHWGGAELASAQLSADAGRSCFYKYNVPFQFKQTWFFFFKKSELSSKCMQLLAMKLHCFLNQRSWSSTQPAAAGTSAHRPKVSVQPGELFLQSSGWACGMLRVLPQNLICPLLCTDGTLSVGKVLTWKLSAVFHPWWVTCSSLCRPSWPDTTYPFQRKYVRHKQEACSCTPLN